LNTGALGSHVAELARVQMGIRAHGWFRLNSCQSSYVVRCGGSWTLPASFVERVAFLLGVAIIVVGPIRQARADETPLHVREQQAFQAAVERVAPAVVRIETVGGLDRVGDVLLGTGPTTGLIISPEGYIISSAFNFVSQPSSVLVGLSDGSRVPAKIVANDLNRMLTLLKIDVEETLPVAETAPLEEMRVGQWSIAIGRTFDAEHPNLSVGLLAAKDRIWGKALQTDAKVSPTNYGGPLIDIHGRVLGVLVPMSPTAKTTVAGVEWYDSGIGFAVPIQDVERLLPRLKQGQDLLPGLLGISLQPGNQFADPPVVALARAGSPAYEAGLKTGDRITAIDGEPLSRITDLFAALRPRYAGDSIDILLERDGEERTVTVELVAELVPYEHPFLGILPGPPNEQGRGVPIRFVYADGPAARAGLEVGDVITALNGEDVADADALRSKIDQLRVEQAVKVQRTRDGQSQTVNVVLGTMPAAIPDSLPSRQRSAADYEITEPAIGEFDNLARVYAPKEQTGSFGLFVWLHGSAQSEPSDRLETWQQHADGLIVATLRPAAGEDWKAGDVDIVRQLVDMLLNQYEIDPERVVLGGHGSGAALAQNVAFDNRSRYRGLVIHGGPLGNAVAQNEPTYRLAYYVAHPEDGPLATQNQGAIERLRGMRYPVSARPLGEKVRSLNDDERAEVIRWIDTLDRI